MQRYRTIVRVGFVLVAAILFFVALPTFSQKANAAICGGSCSQDADCQRATGGGFQPVCYQGKCSNPLCPSYTTPGTICGCEAAPTGIACGELCGGQNNGLVYPHNCLNGTCGNNENGGDSGNRCLPNTAPGYIMQGGICKNDPNTAVFCLSKADGTKLGNIADIVAACAAANPNILGPCDTLCNGTTALCQSGLTCTTISDGTQRCRNANASTDTTCAGPTPTPSTTILACLSITQDNSNPVVGQNVTFTCGQLSGVNHYEFQYRVNSTVGTVSPASTNSNVSQPLKITQAGGYDIQCRPCTTTDESSCTPWQATWQ